jgi:hypothetical protein
LGKRRQAEGHISFLFGKITGDRQETKGSESLLFGSRETFYGSFLYDERNARKE